MKETTNKSAEENKSINDSKLDDVVGGTTAITPRTEKLESVDYKW